MKLIHLSISVAVSARFCACLVVPSLATMAIVVGTVVDCVMRNDYECRVLEYTNHKHKTVATVWVNPENKISFQSKWTTSEFHGLFQDEDHEGRLRMFFHYDGDESKAKTAVAIRFRQGLWEGHDGCNRSITVRFLFKLQYCQTCEAWHRMP